MLWRHQGRKVVRVRHHSAVSAVRLYGVGGSPAVSSIVPSTKDLSWLVVTELRAGGAARLSVGEWKRKGRRRNQNGNGF